MAATDPTRGNVLDKKVLAYLSVVLPFAVVAEVDDLEVQHYNAIPGSCVATEDPRACMESYEYRCEHVNGTHIAVAAYYLSCNAQLSNGRAHFAQILFDGEGWVVELQHVYVPEPVIEQDEPTEPDLILQAYIQRQFRDDESIIASSGSEHMGRLIVSSIGDSRHSNVMAMRALCGIIVDEGPGPEEVYATKKHCNSRLLRSIKMFGQSDQSSPFRVAGANEIRWREMSAVLKSNDSAYVLEGRYEFPEGHVSCRLQPQCCSSSLSYYLDSCREPKEGEEAVVNACLAEGRKRKTKEYEHCLQSNGVRIGCEAQDDGSRLCY